MEDTCITGDISQQFGEIIEHWDSLTVLKNTSSWASQGNKTVWHLYTHRKSGDLSRDLF